MITKHEAELAALKKASALKQLQNVLDKCLRAHILLGVGRIYWTTAPNIAIVITGVGIDDDGMFRTAEELSNL